MKAPDASFIEMYGCDQMHVLCSTPLQGIVTGPNQAWVTDIIGKQLFRGAWLL